MGPIGGTGIKLVIQTKPPRPPTIPIPFSHRGTRLTLMNNIASHPKGPPADWQTVNRRPTSWCCDQAQMNSMPWPMGCWFQPSWHLRRLNSTEMPRGAWHLL